MDRSTATYSVVGTVAAIGVVGYLWQLSHKKREVEVKPLHVKYDSPKPPAVVRLIAALPASVRRYLILKDSAPRPPTDGCDVLGEDGHDPYEYTELVEGRLWRVRYKTLEDFKMFKAFLESLGMDMFDPAIINRAPTHMREMLKEDMQRISDLLAAEKKNGSKALLDAGAENSQDMLVVRLEDTGGLLLFNPCRMRPMVMEWLRSRGQVEWIVSGSNFHTNQMPQAAAAFPLAKILCAAVANAKCTFAGMRKADYIYTDPVALQEAKTLLKKSGVVIHPITGDIIQAMCVLAHRHLFEVDLLYGHADGDRPVFLSRKSFEEGRNSAASFGRFFYFGSIYGEASPHGMIPKYRYIMLDPFHPSSKMMMDPPLPDGSSCTKMAQSLRELLKLNFDAADMVHSALSDSLLADEFRRCIDASWNWLDGQSLL